MTKYRDLDPLDPIPADLIDALNEYVSTLAANFVLQIKPGDATTLQVPAGPDNAQAAIGINGRWRYNAATVERASPGGPAQTFDVHVTASDNDFRAPAAGQTGEQDFTVYSFALAITAAGVAPAGVALSRKVGTAPWDGAAFTDVVQTVGSNPAALPTGGQKAALAGTSGAPGAANPYVTSTDPRVTVPRVTALTPGAQGIPNPVPDGFRVVFVADATKGILWPLRYNLGSASPYKWEAVGPSALLSIIDGNSIVSSVNWTAYGGPSLTLPLAGDYEISYGARAIADAGAGGHSVQASYAVNGAAPIPDDGIDSYTAGGTGVAVNTVRTRPKNGLPAGTTLVENVKDDVGNAGISARWLRAMPVRVG